MEIDKENNNPFDITRQNFLWAVYDSKMKINIGYVAIVHSLDFVWIHQNEQNKMERIEVIKRSGTIILFDCLKSETKRYEL